MLSKYTYTLLSNNTGERLVLTNAPSGWDDTNVNLVRDLTYLGVLKTITVEFAFVGEGFTFLQKHRLRFGWDFSVILRVALRKGNEFQFQGKINPVPSGNEERKYNRFKCDVIQSAAVQKFQNREDTEINALNNISMDQQEVVPVQPRPGLFRGKRVDFMSEFESVTEDPGYMSNHTIPFITKSNGNPGVHDVFESQLGNNQENGEDHDGPDDPPIKLSTVTSAFAVNIYDVPQTFEVTWGYTKKITVIEGAILDTAFKSNRNIIRIYNADGTVREVLYEELVHLPIGWTGDPANDNKTFSLSGHHTFVLDVGEYAVFTSEEIWDETTIPSFRYHLAPFLAATPTYSYIESYMTVRQDSAASDTTHPVVLPHELFQNLISQINGLRLHSPVFGRVDLGYPEDGEFAYLATTLGSWLRGIPVEETQYQTSLKSAFLSYSSVICLGLSISDDVITIDKLGSLFNNNVNADLGEVEDFGVSPLTEFMFNEVWAGFPTNEYEEQNGRDEFNTATIYTNSLQSYKKKLDIRSIYCGDGYGIEFARRAGIVNTGTADTRYDDKIFFIDMLPQEDNSLISRRMEGILLASGMFSPETCMNLRIYPGQNMKRWKMFLNIPLDKKPDKKLFFQSKDKNITSIIVTELGPTADGTDIDLGTQAYFLPDAHNFKCPVKMTHLPGIIANPLGLTKFTYEGENFYDYLLHINAEREKGRADWKMMGTISTPPDTSDSVVTGPYLKYGDGLEDFIKHADGDDDFIKYQD